MPLAVSVLIRSPSAEITMAWPAVVRGGGSGVELVSQQLRLRAPRLRRHYWRDTTQERGPHPNPRRRALRRRHPLPLPLHRRARCRPVRDRADDRRFPRAQAACPCRFR